MNVTPPTVFEAAIERHAVLSARYDDAIAVLRQLLRFHDPKQMCGTLEQQAWREAGRCIAESERT